ncbi:helix-hairpin-helix domain-containing protein [Vallitalea okinawensis]|uniref:helix-hairpin-helix domain-containing protein n=1 Tax=Vallitalea okinawensis TaxID=2078660 RepID=UPI0014791E3C|nr:helix-hairpin-helix domain-containing protein [Vallitalea okinawensis]
MKYTNKSVIITTVFVIGFVISCFAYIISIDKNIKIYTNDEKEGSSNSMEANNREDISQIQEISPIEESEIELIKVHVSGAVAHPDVVYTLEKDSRVEDAIKAAGDLSDEADLKYINLAAKIKDGQKIYIPSKSDDPNEIMNLIADNIKIDTIDGLININTASKIELMTLKGIGESTATKIINYREENGAFQTLEELKYVNGIGEATFESIKNEITK